MREQLSIPAGFHGALWGFDHDHRSPMHTHEELELNLCTAGRAKYLVRGELVDLAPGSLLWLFPDEDHVLVEASPDFAMWIAVFGEDAVGQFRQHPTGHLLSSRLPEAIQIRRLPRASQADLTGLFELLQKVQTDPSAFNPGFCFALITAWTLFLRASVPTERRKVHPAVRKAAQMLRQDPTLNGGELAEAVGLSPSHLSRLFGAQLGVSIVHYRQAQRVDRVIRLAQTQPGLSASALAHEAGFGSYAQFYRVLVQHYGRPPAWLLARFEEEVPESEPLGN